MDAAFQDWVDAARQRDIAAEAQLRARLKPSGSELVGPCPVCGGRDRFAVHRRKRVFHCRGCGAGGDVIALVQHLDGCDFRTACERLTGQPPPDGAGGRIDAEAARRREEERARREAEEAQNASAFRERGRRKAYGIWSAGLPFAGSPAEAYLAGRGLAVPPGAPLRCHPDLPYWHSPSPLPSPARGRGERGRATASSPPQAGQRQRGGSELRVIHRGPAMLAAIVDADGFFAGVHCTYLGAAVDGWVKATIADPETGELLPAKKVRGSKRRAAIELVGRRRDAPWHLVIGEGIETVLSVHAALVAVRGPEALAGTAFWSAVDLGHLGGRAADRVPHPTELQLDRSGRGRRKTVPGSTPLPEPDRDLMPPESVRLITLLGDGDSDRFATELALTRAAARWAAPDRRIVIAWAPAGRDFNDLLRDGRVA